MKMDDFLKLQEDLIAKLGSSDYRIAQQIVDMLVSHEAQLALQDKKITQLTGLLNASNQRLAECEKVCKAPHVVKLSEKERWEDKFVPMVDWP